MSWEKKGVIYVPDNKIKEMSSHAAIPFATLRKDGLLRIFFSSRNLDGKSLPFFIDVDSDNPNIIKKISPKPIMTLGELGTFDDSGVMPSCFLECNGDLYMYYIGWNPQVTVSYRLAIGLAISRDGGESFVRHSKGPICDRSVDEPFFNTAPYVLKEGDRWRMWYISCTKWDIINDYPEPRYHIKYAESNDGVVWRKTGMVCIDYDEYAEAIGRPCVYKENEIYKMYYSYRKVRNYRTDRASSYKLGYAESTDGINWEKKNDNVGIYPSELDSDWDYEMIEYCHILSTKNKKYMFYNGNGFGKSGFGYAEYSK
jgi:predicted GH43/DUF377 family glycosyl hydrolase